MRERKMSLQSHIRLRAIIVTAGFMIAFSGCSSKSKVRGKVTYQGKPVVWGTVTIVDKNGEHHQAEIDLQGNYEIDKVAVGPCKIAVNSPDPNPPADAGKGRGKVGEGVSKVGGIEDPREKFMAGKQKQEDPRPKPPPGAWFGIPSKYNTIEESELTGEVRGSRTELNIELK